MCQYLITFTSRYFVPQVQVDDASGRYSTGWFWGNIYWTGSQSLCENITPKKRIVIGSQNHSRPVRAAGVALKPTSPTSPLGYQSGPMIYSTGPPFPISFFMLRLHINSSFTTEEKLIHMGLCLPYACADKDVQNIVEETSKSSTKITVNVEAVRSEHNKFNMWGRQNFPYPMVSAVTSMVVALLIVGTSFDFYLEHLKNKQVKEKSGHYNAKLDMAVPDTKSKNGKCGLYVVNNNNNNEVCMNNDDHLQVNTGNNYTPRSRESIIRLVLKETVLSFSLKANIKSICDQTVGSDTIPVLHGLKSINNMEYRKVVQKEFIFQTISNGTFSVDTFFFTSGLLVSFLYFRSNAKGKLDPLTNGRSGLVAGFLHFIGLIAYRFARLTAPYLFTIGVVEVTMKWFNYNSVFEPPTMDHVNCPNYWWRNVLYINTLFPVQEMCMLWSWYLSDDTQFYVVGAVMLILAARVCGVPQRMGAPGLPPRLPRRTSGPDYGASALNKRNFLLARRLLSETLHPTYKIFILIHFKSAAALLITFMASSWLTTGYIAYSNRHMPGSDDPLALFDKIYDKPWTRLGPYLIGMCTGWLLFKKNCRIHMSKLTITIGWIAAVTCLLSLVYGLYEARLPPWVGATYSALSHSAWAMGLSWIVVACVTGYGDSERATLALQSIVNKILSATILYPFSRVTYCAYLIHPVVIRVMVMSMDSPLHLGSIVTIIIFMGQVVASYGLAFIVSLVFEAPAVSMLRIISKVVAVRKSHTAASQS
ncbi:hypothetical protein NQ318_015892 [Aromia moschata]|uniref:Nose resistant-to-fluoxetine protein N-terminal domain-containing protein n=1 Tax=Aromia moschata TaxID=1265417 RepID=A0AAV8Y0X9_9CUCU|nr:hypothetical protein NQ318_015892 [Aromia moschata]